MTLIQTAPSARTLARWKQILDRPIIANGDALLRFNDAYMYNMLDHMLNHDRYSQVRAVFEFVNRRKEIPMALYVDPILMAEQWNHARTLLHSERALKMLSTKVPYSIKLADFLRTYHLPELEIYKDDTNQLVMRTTGNNLIHDFFAEIFALRIQSHIYHISYMMKHNISLEEVEQVTLAQNLMDKAIFDKYQRETGRTPSDADFASRRPLSDWYHTSQIEWYLEHMPGHLTHTSNFYYAWEYDLKIAASLGHVAFIVNAGMAETDEDLRLSHSRFIDEWNKFWASKIPIALVSDTFGTKFSYEGGGIRPDQVAEVSFFRPDSGPDIQVGNETLDFIRRSGFDPIADNKGIIFANSMNALKIVELDGVFGSQMPILYARGQDFGDKSKLLIPSQQTVFKPITVNGRSSGKLTNEPSKARFIDSAEAERYRRVFAV